MKKTLTILLAAATLGLSAQDETGLTWDMVIGTKEKCDKMAADPKKAGTLDYWMKRAKNCNDIYGFHLTGVYSSQKEKDLAVIKFPKKKATEGDFQVYLYDYVNIYLKDGEVVKWAFPQPLVEDPIAIAFEAEKKAIELDADKKKKAKIAEMLTITASHAQSYGYSRYSADKDYSSALKYFTIAIDISETPYINKIDTSLIYNTGVIAEQAGNKEAAIALYQRAAALNYGGTDLARQIFFLYKDLNKTEQGAAYLKAFMDKNPDKAGAVIDDLVNYYLEAKKDNDAIELLNKSITANPTRAIYNFALGALYDKQNKIAEARAQYEKAIEKDPAYSDAYLNLGASYYNQGISYFELANKAKSNVESDANKKKGNEAYKASLPYLTKAADLAKENDKYDIYKTLKGVYLRLNDTPNYEKYKKLCD